MESITPQYEINTNNSLQYFKFRASEFQGTAHGFFTRLGGVSPFPMKSLNLGGGLGDTRENILENQRRIFAAINMPVNSGYDVWQIHSTQVVFAERARRKDEEHLKADAIFTDNPEVTLLMRFADCVPILLYQPDLRIIGIVHAGWKGTVSRICSMAIDQACTHFKTQTGDWVAGIGPSIGPDHYEVGKDIRDLGRDAFREKLEEVFIQKEGRIFMNLWKANHYLLQKAGVKKIFTMDICTACDTNLWFSHRAEKGKTGRFAGVIALA